MAENAAGKLVREYHPMTPETPEMPCRDGRMFTFGRTENRGRVETELIICPSEYVSRQHCDIFYRNGAFWIKDLKSLNGTYLNGQRIVQLAERELRFNDVVGLGVSHEALDVDVRDPQYYIFTFKAQQYEVIDVDSDDEIVSIIVEPIQKAISKPDIQPIDARLDFENEGFEILEEKLNNSTPSLSPSKPKVKSLFCFVPPPPPPPIISKPPNSESVGNRIPSIENLASTSSSAASVSVTDPSKVPSERDSLIGPTTPNNLAQPSVSKTYAAATNNHGLSNSIDFLNKTEVVGSSNQGKIFQKPGPASSKLSLIVPKDISLPSRPNSNIPVVFIPISGSEPKSVTSLETVVKDSSAPDRLSSTPIGNPPPLMRSTDRCITTESSSGDDSSDGMSESCNQQKFVPNIESSPEYSKQTNTISKAKEKRKNPRKDSKLQPTVSPSRSVNKRATNAIIPAGSSSTSKLTLNNCKRLNDDTNSKASKKLKLMDDLKKQIPLVRLRRLIIRNKKTGVLTMEKRKFSSLSKLNRRNISDQFERSYETVHSRSEKSSRSTKHESKKDNEYNSDSSDVQTPFNRKKRRMRSDSIDSEGEDQNEKQNISRYSRIIRAESTDSDSHSSEHQVSQHKNVSSKSPIDNRAASSSKENLPIVPIKIVTPPPKDEQPLSSVNFVLEENDQCPSPVSDTSLYSENEFNLNEDDPMETAEEQTNIHENKSSNLPRYQPPQKKNLPRKIQFLSIPPAPPEFARKMDSARRRAQVDLENRVKTVSKRGTFANDKEVRTQKLKEVARKEPHRSLVDTARPNEIRHQAPVKVKKTPRNRNQDLIESMMGSEQIQKELERATATRTEEAINLEEKTISAPQREIPYPSQVQSEMMPLHKTQNEMDRFKANEDAKKKMPPPTIQSGPSVQNHNNLINKSKIGLEDRPKYLPTTSTPTVVDYRHRHHIPSKPGCSKPRIQNVSHRSTSIEEGLPVPEDEAYKGVLQWRPEWLEEQKKVNTPPPVTKGYDRVRTLYEYKDYKSYVEIFFPLILLEIWATVTQDFLQKRKPRDRSHCNYETNVQEHPVAIDVFTPTQECPMLRKKKGDQKGADMFWTQIQCHALTKRLGEMNLKRDLAILTLQLDTTDDKGNKIKRDYFGFILNQSEKDLPLTDPIVTVDPQLHKICPHSKIKHCMTIVIHLSHADKVDRTALASLKRVSYISPKLRDVKALNYLKYSKLIGHIINPQPPKVMYDPNVVPSQHLLVAHVSRLNSCQKSIVAHVSERVWSDDPELLLLHGPPGTGKTRTIVGMVLQLLLFKRKKLQHARILVCTPSNTALDEVMSRCEHAISELPRDNEIRMVRLGETDGSKMKKYGLDYLARQKEENNSTAASIRDAIVQCDKEIIEKTSEIDQLKSAPQHSKTTLESCQRELRELETRRDDYKTDFSNRRIDKSSYTTTKKKILERANLVFSTLNSCSNSYLSNTFGPRSGKNKPFLCCIVDEASQTTEPETLAPLILQVEKLILVGDPHQLGATVLSTEASQKDFGLSLFARLHHFYTRTLKVPGSIMMLTQQYRMHPEILAWPNEYFYKGQLKTHCIGRKDDDKCILKPYLFLNMSSHESSNKQGQISNEEEVKMVVNMIRNIGLMITTKKQKSWSIGVITPYSTQKGAIKEALRNQLPTVASLVEVDTVDSFQGREKDIIIISCVRTDDTGFLKNPLRLNVALTRAKYSLLMVGDAECLKKDPMWKSLIENAIERNCHYDIDPNDKSNPGFFRKRLYTLLSPTKSQIPEQQRTRDWLGT